MKTAIITGVTGQDGAYLSRFLLQKNYRVIGLTRNNHADNVKRLVKLNIFDKMVVRECDLLDFSSCIKIFREFNPDEIYNLAAQSSVGLSFDQPIGTMQYNVSSVLNILESIRFLELKSKYYQASSSEMYGKVQHLPIYLDTPMHPLSPYAISKATAFWTVANYRESYGLFACNGVLFNHESKLRDHTFFIKKVIIEAIKIKYDPSHMLHVGNINIKRDFGYSPKYVEAMWLMLQKDDPKDYIICSGVSTSLKTIVEYVFKSLDIPIDRYAVDPALFRPNEIIDIYGDNKLAREELGWECDLTIHDILDIMIKDELENHQTN